MTLSKWILFVLEKSVVLDVIFYQSIEDLSQEETSGRPLVICPSPMHADGLRRVLSDQLEIITISKWVSDYLKKNNLIKANKAVLMLRLSSVWRHYFPDGEVHLFLKAFELFTDLRSFTLNLELLSELFKELDDDTTKSILLFWTFLENEKIIDEHKSYHEMGQGHFDRPLWIIGFRHLSGIQIDMLKQIGDKTEVAVFFPKDVYAETLSTDWIRWLKPEAEIENQFIEKKLRYLRYPKNKLNIVLGALKNKIPEFDIALGGLHLNFHSKQETMMTDQFFKSSEDLFFTQREKLVEELAIDIGEGKIALDDFRIKLKNKEQAALRSEDYICYKTLLLLNEAIDFYEEFQTSIDLFALKILKMILELNSPRVSLATLLENPKMRLLDLNELAYKESSLPLVLIASSLYGPLKGSESKYSEKMNEALRVIAPIKRAGLDFLYLKTEVRQQLTSAENILLMEEGLELVDLSWREILKDFVIDEIDLKTDYFIKERKDYLSELIRTGSKEVRNFSASRLQTFIDCPRKYYFSYIEKMDHRPVERLQIAPDEMGTIEHKVIQNYFEGKKTDLGLAFNSSHHEVLCQQALSEFLEQNKIQINEKLKLKTFYEILHYTQNGIEYLIDFCHKHSADKIHFEYALPDNPWGLIGSIDCIVELADNQIGLFDFKRSDAAIGAKKETQSFEKIQIWTYLLIMMNTCGKKIHSWGYLNLSETKSSQVYSNSDSPVLDEATLGSFEKLLSLTIEKLKSESCFLAKPRNEKNCDFCEVQLFCDKGRSYQ